MPIGPPLRVLHLDSGREWRGGQRQVYLLARGQREQGHEPLVIAAPEAPLLRRLRSAGIAAAAVRMRGDWDLAAARRVRAVLRTWNADVVHAHDARAHAIALAALIGRRSLPLIVTRRVPFVPRGRLKYGKRVARFIAISSAVSDALVAGGVDPSRIDLVYSGVPRPTVSHARDWRAECRWPADSVVCGIVGAMTAEKGVATLEDIGRRLSDATRARIRLVLLGGQSAGSQPVGGIDAFRAGFVDEIHAAMAGLDVLLHPSSAEGLGTAVIDAMSLGVPPIAFRVGGLPELIQDGASGVLVPAGDAAAFAAATERLVRDTGFRRSLASAGPARAADFGVDRMVRGTQAAYDSILTRDLALRR
ncbi:MAG TPA: glycosyltransferase family 4 protein [Gemmatimonadaceae bacterium]|nr:glycosyltransferase family 4 protein [Gemmatimonadaceae bacterium]